jgi:hypothetical protein
MCTDTFPKFPSVNISVVKEFLFTSFKVAPRLASLVERSPPPPRMRKQHAYNVAYNISTSIYPADFCRPMVLNFFLHGIFGLQYDIHLSAAPYVMSSIPCTRYKSRMSTLSCPSRRQLYRTGSQHSPGHPVTAAVLYDNVKHTCTLCSKGTNARPPNMRNF